jgi:hypothetical protein
MATTPTSAPLKQALPDSWLGGLFLRLLPGCLYFAPSFVMPLVTVCAAVGAVYGPALLAAAATLPLVRDAPLAVGLLTALGTQQPWCGVARLGLSLLSVWYAFVMMPLLDAALGSDFRNPAGGGGRERAGPGDRLYRGILYAYVPVHLFTLGAACHLANQTNSGTAAALPPAALFGVAVSCGVANGILFTVRVAARGTAVCRFFSFIAAFGGSSLAARGRRWRMSCCTAPAAWTACSRGRCWRRWAASTGPVRT